MALLAAVPTTEVAATTPTRVVEMQFTPGVWTDVTPWVNDNDPLTYTARGRPDLFDATQPSVLNATLDNTDGRFTPDRVASPYYPYVTFGRPLRFGYSWQGVRYWRWYGTTNRLPTTWPSGPNVARVKLAASDRITKLAKLRKLRTLLAEEILYDNPVAYYPLTDPAGDQADIGPKGFRALEVRSRGNQGTIEYQSATGPSTDDASSIKLTRGADANSGRVDGYYLYGTGAYAGAVGVTETLTVECWFAASADGKSPTMTHFWLGSDQNNFYLLRTFTNGRLQAVGMSDGVSAGQLTNTVSVVDGLVHHAALTVEVSTGTTTKMRLYLDGQLRGTLDGQPRVAKALNRLTVGMDTYVPNTSNPIGAFNGGLSHVAVFGTALNAATITRHYTAGKTGFAKERSDQRFLRWARLAGITDVAAEVGRSTMGVQQSAGKGPLELLEDVVAAEHGTMFPDGHGQLVMHGRGHRYNQTSAFTLTAAQILDDTEFPGDEQGMVNDARYTRPGGSTAGRRAVNQESIDFYGERFEDVRELPYADDLQLASAAAWRVTTFGWARQRLSSVTVDLLSLPADLVVALINAEVGTRFTVTALPSQAPSTSVDLSVEGVGPERIGPGVWQLTFNTSPAVFGRAWILNDPVLSVLNTSTYVAF